MHSSLLLPLLFVSTALIAGDDQLTPPNGNTTMSIEPTDQPHNDEIDPAYEIWFCCLVVKFLEDLS